MNRAFASALLVLSLAACADEPEGAPAPECERNSDCPDPSHLCLDGACRAECGDSRDCLAGEVCEEGRCARAPIACEVDLECPDGMRCDAGLCAAAETPCSTDLECDASQRCVEARCRTVECVTDAECVAGATCTAGACVEPAAECVRNSDCPASERCVAGRCEAECDVDVDCGLGERCVAGRCGPECVSAVDCGADELCAGGRCVPECVADRDCGVGQVCRTGRCEAECVVDPDCPVGEGCVAGRCEPLPPTDPFGGAFQLSTSAGIQRCNDYTSLQYQSRVVDAVQDGAAYTFVFPTSTYFGTIDEGGSFQVSWSGFQDTSPACGDMNTSNTYSGTFAGPDLFTATLAVDFYFDVPACNCTLWFPITGTRL